VSHLLQIDNVTKRFGGLVAVDDVTLNQEEGEILGLIGPNGAGKTTLFNMISGAYTPTAGQIRYEGVDTTGMAPHKICKLGIARTFQIAKPFANLSVVDNVQVGVFLHTDSMGSGGSQISSPQH
jgi:branched-chain amino acid transport system ATP-binding protein